MTNYNNLCMGCMNPLLPEETKCSRCGFDRLSVQSAPCLPLRTVLKQNYVVGAVSSKTNTCITYCGFDLQKGTRVNIHEFFPEKIAFRSGDEKQASPCSQYSALYYQCLNSFDELWKTLQTLNGIDVLETPYDIFYLNNTVYAVTDYKQCITIRQYLDSNGVLLSWQQACETFIPVFDALDYLHRSGIIHSGINVSTVTIGSDGKIHLSAPGIPLSVASVPEVEAVLQDGYAPIELYDRQFQIGPEADIYSLMAVMYICMTGVSPQKSTERIQKDAMIIPHSLASGMTSEAIGVLIKSLKVYPNERFHSVGELKNHILSSLRPDSQAAVSGSNASYEAPIKAGAPTPAGKNPEEKKKPDGNAKKDSGRSIVLKTLISILIIGFVV
ncbi:MAG: protein kinase, partial [Acutalibacteraceae bacterium]